MDFGGNPSLISVITHFYRISIRINGGDLCGFNGGISVKANCDFVLRTAHVTY